MDSRLTEQLEPGTEPPPLETAYLAEVKKVWKKLSRFFNAKTTMVAQFITV